MPLPKKRLSAKRTKSVKNAYGAASSYNKTLHQTQRLLQGWLLLQGKRAPVPYCFLAQKSQPQFFMRLHNFIFLPTEKAGKDGNAAGPQHTDQRRRHVDERVGQNIGGDDVIGS